MTRPARDDESAEEESLRASVAAAQLQRAPVGCDQREALAGREHQHFGAVDLGAGRKFDAFGFDHDEYVDQVAWDVHPAFRPRGKAADEWLKQAFDELVGAKGT
jgi:hypothetical protein